MRALLSVLLILSCFSVVTAPLNRLHAHVDAEHEHTHVHGGHVHDGADHHGVVDEGQVIYLDAKDLQQAAKNLAWATWLPLCVVSLILLLVPVARLPWSPRRQVRVASQYPPWPPPLRGPPLSA